MIKQCVAGTLTIKQHTDLRQIDLVHEYDMAVAAISWEQRATAAFRSTKTLPKNATFIRFASSDPTLNRLKNNAEDVLSGLFQKIDQLKLTQSTNFYENAQQIETYFRDKFESVGRPLRILLDITCMPKSYLLFLIGMGFSRDFFCRVDCTYAEGYYDLQAPTPDPVSGTVGLISEGEWGALQIPYLVADSAIPAHRDLIVAMGGEISLSIPFVERYEPRRLGLVLIGESLAQAPERLPASEGAALGRLLEEGNVDRADIPLADVVGMINHVTEFCETTTSETVSGIAIGSKPHALALGVAALNNENLEIICRVPKRYRPLDVAPAGPLSFYQIEDRFEPSSYLD